MERSCGCEHIEGGLQIFSTFSKLSIALLHIKGYNNLSKLIKHKGEIIMANQIYILNAAGERKAEITSPNTAVLTWHGEYEPGDVIMMEVDAPGHYMVRVDDCVDESLVYLTGTTLRYPVIFDEKKNAHNPKAFEGARHYLTLRPAAEWELGYRNLAVNAADQHDVEGVYPHATANVETRGEAVFAARNAIDGVLGNRSHGHWPYASWGINMQDDAELTLNFGRPVDFDTIVLVTRADFPHDNWWVEATFTFSDGTSEVVSMEKSYEPHRFAITRKGITWIKLGNLIKADDPSPFPALTQIEVYGTDAK